MCFKQGYFTHWVDQSPVYETAWYRPAKFSFTNWTLYVLEDGYYKKISKVKRVDYSKLQPEMSTLKNCTAVLPDLYLEYFSWITIPCDETFEMTYICERNRPQHFEIRPPPDKTCDANWLTFEGEERCLSILSIERELTFYDSQYLCSLENASLFNVDASAYTYTTTKMNELEAYLSIGLYSLFKSKIPSSFLQLSNNERQKLLFGERVDETSTYNMLLHMFWLAKPEPSEYLAFFVVLNHTCAIVEFSAISFHFVNFKHQTRGWGVKCRPCTQYINISGIICEKPSRQRIITCQTKHFQCHDKTCILLIYQCDDVADCFDGSDEVNCDPGIYMTLPEGIATLPCLFRRDCKISCIVQIPIHSICDGVFMNGSFPEEEVCSNNGHTTLEPIINSYTKAMLGMSKVQPEDFAWLYKKEENSKCDNSSHIKSGRSLFTNRSNNLDTLNVTKASNTDCTNIGIVNLCMPGMNNKNTCSVQSSNRRMCQYISCPGMFKCNGDGFDYCISIANVCDKKYDCRSGADEQFCSNLTCPGFLKCRGEKRCVDTNDICDKIIDCKNTMDDEAECGSCPDNCKCNGYVISCFLNNSREVLDRPDRLHAKALIIKGVQNRLIVEKHISVIGVGLLLLNISFCHLGQIGMSNVTQMTSVHILIADLSHNELKEIYFLKIETFTKIVFLDLSFNLLCIIKYGQRLSLKYLSVLYLKGNTIKELMSVADNSRLALIDIQYIDYYNELSLLIYPNTNVQLVVKVSDSVLCCMFADNIVCLTKNAYVICHGLIETFTSQIIFYCVSLICGFVSTLACLKHVQKITVKHISKKTNNYIIMVMSQLSSSLCCSVYVILIALADIFKVNLFHFRRSFHCYLLNAILYVTLETTFIFKVSSIGIISLNIVYPFKHQCTWLQWTGLSTVCIWGLIILSYLIHIYVELLRQDHVEFDNLCSIGWCGMVAQFNILYGMIYIVDTLSFFAHIYSVSKVYYFLKNHIRCVHLNSTKTYSVHGVTSKLVLKMLFEIIFRLYLVSLMTFKMSNLNHKYFCFYLFMYVLPSNLFLSSCIHCKK